MSESGLGSIRCLTISSSPGYDPGLRLYDPFTVSSYTTRQLVCCTIHKHIPSVSPTAHTHSRFQYIFNLGKKIVCPTRPLRVIVCAAKPCHMGRVWQQYFTRRHLFFDSPTYIYIYSVATCLPRLFCAVQQLLRIRTHGQLLRVVSRYLVQRPEH